MLILFNFFLNFCTTSVLKNIVYYMYTFPVTCKPQAYKYTNKKKRIKAQDVQYKHNMIEFRSFQFFVRFSLFDINTLHFRKGTCVTTTCKLLRNGTLMMHHAKHSVTAV